MPTHTPSGIFIQPYLLKLMVAASSTFQTLTKTANATDAQRHIFLPGVELRGPDGEVYEDRAPPRAIINDETPRRRTKVGNGLWKLSASLMLAFELWIPMDVAAEGYENSARWFMTQTGSLISDLESLSGTGTSVSGQTHLNVVEFRQNNGPFEVYLGEETEIPDPDRNEYAKSLWHIDFEVEVF